MTDTNRDHSAPNPPITPVGVVPSEEHADKEEEKTGKRKRKERRLKNEPRSLTMEDVPDSVQVMSFFEARAKEFSSMVNALKKKGGSKRIFQRLPRHMRRRATSHNVKRLPRHLQEQAMNESLKMDAAKKNNAKTATRKKRRRPSNLRAEYQSRQKDKRWLETHIWHAKRMKMVRKWGFRIAESCNDKGCRVNYRYTKGGAIISDISYYSCIELAGKRSDLIGFLSPMFPNETGGILLTGDDNRREIGAVMYKPHLYPYHCVGPVHFLWRSDNVSDNQLLWVWTHPSIYMQVLEIFEAELKIGSMATSKDAVPVVKVTSLRDELIRFRLIGPQALPVLMSVLQLKKPPLPKPLPSLPFIESELPKDKPVLFADDHRVDQGVKEELTVDEKHLRVSQKWTEISKTSSQRKWWCCTGDASVPLNDDVVTDNLQHLANSGKCLPNDDGLVYGLVVEDPRMFTPGSKKVECCVPAKKKCEEDWLLEMSNLVTKGSEMDNDENSCVVVVSNESKQQEEIAQFKQKEALVDCAPCTHNKTLSQSQIWSTTVRNKVSSSKIPDCVINDIRGQHFIKPCKVDLGMEASAIPVLLINKVYSTQQRKTRPASTTLTGWDIVMPSNWGMAFWIPLIYSGARACGLKELATCVSLECLVPGFPDDFPDTISGQTAATDKKVELEGRYLRYPPDKRPNFGKLRIQYPFSSEWNELLASRELEGRKRSCLEEVLSDSKEKKLCIGEDIVACQATEATEHKCNFYVLRSAEDLSTLSKFIETLFAKCWQRTRTDEKYKQIYSKCNMDDLLTRHGKCIVAVRMEAWSRGSLQSRAMISLPTGDDILALKSDKCAVGPQEVLCPRGVTLIENNKTYIGEYHVSSKEVKAIQKQRKEILKQERNNEKVQNDIPSLVNVLKLDPVESSRLTIGRIHETVGYRYTSSRHSAVGHCSLKGIVRLCQVCFIGNAKYLVALTRGHSLQYVASFIKV